MQEEGKESESGAFEIIEYTPAVLPCRGHTCAVYIDVDFQHERSQEFLRLCRDLNRDIKELLT